MKERKNERTKKEGNRRKERIEEKTSWQVRKEGKNERNDRKTEKHYEIMKERKAGRKK